MTGGRRKLRNGEFKWVLLFIKHYYGNEVQGRKRDGTHSTHEEDETFQVQGHKTL
jgi:hypothetical protein